MMKHYLTINEFAKLRNVNANSLRYYEKLGLLIPAWTDPRTKYRYYLPEQLEMLDVILLCIKLGIPLKNLTQYIDQSGAMDGKKILEDGRAVMRKKIADMQADYDLTQFHLKNIELNEQFRDEQKIYRREIEERYLIVQPFSGSWNNLIQKERAAMDLFYQAQEQQMLPVFPAGILVHYEAQSVSFSFFFQVLYPPEQDERIIRIPRAVFSCMQADLTSETDILALLRENFTVSPPQTILLSNMLLDKLHFDSRHSEIQVCAPKRADQRG